MAYGDLLRDPELAPLISHEGVLPEAVLERAGL